METDEQTIKQLMQSIQQATASLEDTFEVAILRHEEQFIHTYRVKMGEVLSMIEEMKRRVDEKMLDNAVTKQVETLIKERDYFKYQCLRLNTQNNTLVEDGKNLLLQNTNISEQMKIYRHLLQTQKLKSSEVDANATRLKKNLNDIVSKNLMASDILPCQRQSNLHEKENVRLRKELKEKAQTLRVLREQIQEMESEQERVLGEKVEKREMYDLFRQCVDAWRKENRSRVGKENTRNLLKNPLLIKESTKKQLLRSLFTQEEFLQFLERLLFDESFKVTFESDQEQKFMHENRLRLNDYMSKRSYRTLTRSKLV